MSCKHQKKINERANMSGINPTHNNQSFICVEPIPKYTRNSTFIKFLKNKRIIFKSAEFKIKIEKDHKICILNINPAHSEEIIQNIAKFTFSGAKLTAYPESEFPSKFSSASLITGQDKVSESTHSSNSSFHRINSSSESADSSSTDTEKTQSNSSITPRENCKRRVALIALAAISLLSIAYLVRRYMKGRDVAPKEPLSQNKIAAV